MLGVYRTHEESGQAQAIAQGNWLLER